MKVASGTDRGSVGVLVSNAQAGDESAFAELVRLHQNRAVAYATAILGDYQLGQDAAQEAFVDAFRKLRSLQEPGAFGSWLRTIVFKHCDRMTRGKRLPLSGLESALDLASPAQSPHDVLEARENRGRVRDAIATLSGLSSRPCSCSTWVAARTRRSPHFLASRATPSRRGSTLPGSTSNGIWMTSSEDRKARNRRRTRRLRRRLPA